MKSAWWQQQFAELTERAERARPWRASHLDVIEERARRSMDHATRARGTPVIDLTPDEPTIDLTGGAEVLDAGTASPTSHR